MKIDQSRFRSAVRAMSWHFGASFLVALFVALLVFAVWYTYPYRQLAGGTGLFFLVMGVDLICGPLLTLVLFNPSKSRRELFLDLGLVVSVQLGALVYGVWTVHEARPLYFVHEVDRFKVITRVDVDATELEKLPAEMKPRLFKGPQPVGLRDATADERKVVMFESVKGGKDYGERPSFYSDYNGSKAYLKAHPLADFVKKHPNRKDDVNKLLADAHVADVADAGKQWRYLPIIARKDWVAVLNPQGAIVGYVEGDGF